MRWFLTAILVFSIALLLIPSLTFAQAPVSTVRLSSAGEALAQPSVQQNAQAAAVCSSPYTVISGDTFTGIAQKCAVAYVDLLAANLSITNPDLIFPGQQINIPQSGPGIPPTGGQTYTVVSGDRLFRIALRYNTTVQAILNANPWISDPNLIFPGWVITIPGGPGIPPTGGQTYTVVAGDTLSNIAFRFNTTTAALLSANTWITNPDLIFPGWVITIR